MAKKTINSLIIGIFTLALTLGGGVVTAGTDGAYDQAILSKLWEKNLYLKLIIDDQPNRFSDVDRYILMMAKGIQIQNDQRARLRALTSELNSALYGEYLSRTSDAAAEAYSRVSLKIQKYLEKKDPEACYNWSHRNESKMQALQSLDQETLQEYKNALTEAVRQAIFNPQPPVEDAAANKIIKDIALKLKDKYKGNLHVEDPENARNLNEKLEVCRITIDVTEALLTYPIEKISVVTRSVFEPNN